MSRSTSKGNQRQQRTENVEGAWLLKAFAAVVAAAIVCTYLTLCFLFYRGQWQVVLHPNRTSATGPAPEGLIHFAPGDTGQPQLTGTWHAAPAGSRYGGLTILFLHGGDAKATDDATATQTALQQMGLNVFAFDYRGYGWSENIHPSEQRMVEDCEAAWSYLTGTRGVRSTTIVPYGVGVGASLAAGLAAAHPEIPAVILDSPYTDLTEVIRRDSRFRLLPFGFLFHEDFPLGEPLSRLQRPKLLFVRSTEPAAFRGAADPKMTVSLKNDSVPAFDQSVTRFLDQYVPVSSPAPSDTKLR